MRKSIPRSVAGGNISFKEHYSVSITIITYILFCVQLTFVIPESGEYLLLIKKDGLFLLVCGNVRGTDVGVLYLLYK